MEMEAETEVKTETERRVGTIYSWNEKGFALIFVTHKQRYFMHISEFDSIAVPIVGDRVSFEVAPPRKEGGLPCAVDVRPIAPAEVEVL